MPRDESPRRGALVHVQNDPCAARVLDGAAHVVISLSRDGTFAVHAYHDGQQDSAARAGDSRRLMPLIQAALREADEFLGVSREPAP